MRYDFLGVVCVIYFLIVENSNIETKIISFILMITKYNIIIFNATRIEERLNLSGNMVHLWTLSKLGSKAIVICHIVATFYYLLGWYEMKYLNYKDSWIQVMEIEGENAFVKYIESYYWVYIIIIKDKNNYYKNIIK